eukprot:s2917_g11.t2
MQLGTPLACLAQAEQRVQLALSESAEILIHPTAAQKADKGGLRQQPRFYGFWTCGTLSCSGGGGVFWVFAVFGPTLRSGGFHAAVSSPEPGKAPFSKMAPKRSKSQEPSRRQPSPAPQRSKLESKGAKPGPAKPIPKSKAAPKATARPATNPKGKLEEILEKARSDTHKRSADVEVRLREALVRKEAQLELAMQKAGDMEQKAVLEQRRAEEAVRRAAFAEGQAEELRQRASRVEELQLEMAHKEARAADAEARAEVLGQMQEKFQRTLPDMVKSIAEGMVLCRGRRDSSLCDSAGISGFRGVAAKLELEDSPGSLKSNPAAIPLLDAEEGKDSDGKLKTTGLAPDDAASELLKFYGQNDGAHTVHHLAPVKDDRAMDADSAPQRRFTAAITEYEDVGGHVEYCLKVTHCSGISWTTWRRFSDFHHAHEELCSLVDARDLPPGPERSWLPAFTQSLSVEFCEQREQELSRYLQRLLGHSAAAPAPLRNLLGLRRPDTPGSLRVVPKAGVLELEVKPPEAQTFPDDCHQRSSKVSELGGPVDGYYIEVVNLDSGSKHRLARDVGASGTLPQKAQVGHLDSGRHLFIVAAYNGAGCSGQVSITVDPALAFASAQRAPPSRSGPGMGQSETEPRQAPGPLPAQNASSHGGYVRHVGSQPPIPRETCLPPLAPTPLGPSAGPSGRPIPGQLPASRILTDRGKACADVHRKSPGPEEDEDLMCVVCLASPKTHAFVPCGHRCVCGPPCGQHSGAPAPKGCCAADQCIQARCCRGRCREEVIRSASKRGRAARYARSHDGK